ncbi:MAG: NUDIX hydrolase [Prevotellaceae bacterium]|nr:NUDIX hydrolase [Prevotellaceae bacterium]
MDIKKWKLLSSEYIIKRPWLTARKDTLQMPNGTIVPDFYVLEYPAWVNIIAITKDKKFVMVRQYRHALGIVEYELCAGVVEATDNSPMDAAKRELLEETGFGGGEWEEYMSLSANPTSMNNISYTFIARNVEAISNQELDEGEDLSVHLLSREQLMQLLQNGEIMQSLMVAPLWRFFAEKK